MSMTCRMPRIRNDKTPSLRKTPTPSVIFGTSAVLSMTCTCRGHLIHSLQAGSQASHEIPLGHLHVLREFLLTSLLLVLPPWVIALHSTLSYACSWLVPQLCEVTSSTCNISNEVLFVTILHRTNNCERAKLCGDGSLYDEVPAPSHVNIENSTRKFDRFPFNLQFSHTALPSGVNSQQRARLHLG